MALASVEKIQRVRGLGRRNKRMPWVIPVSCEGCGSCVQACPQQGLVMLETNREGVYVPWLLEPALCIGCGKCAEVCVMGALVMTSYVQEAYDRFENKRPTLPSD